MYLEEPLPFIKTFIKELNQNLVKSNSQYYLSKTQRYWLGFCILAILVTNSVCWARFERVSLKTHSQAALSWMFRHSKISWNNLMISSVMTILAKYGIESGVLSLDDSDNPRSKIASKIHKVHKLKDKKSGGFLNGQSLVMLVLISEHITFPVGFAFYAPDPAIKQWDSEDKSLKKDGVKKKDRPVKPAYAKQYPPKQELALKLLQDFSNNFSNVEVAAVVADTLYGTDDFMDAASKTFDSTQVVSQLRKNQIIYVDNKALGLNDFFKTQPCVDKVLKLRGNLVRVTYSYVIAKVKAHDSKKRIIIALKYENEEQYRYLVATDLTWSAETIIKVYALRWLVEVFFQDWKSYEGWGQLTKHTGYEGSSRSLILSLLLDHCLFFHPEQKVRIEDKLPACTVGSLREKIIVESLIQFIQKLLNDPNPKKKLEELTKNAEIIFKPNSSSKHMNTVDIKFGKIKKAA